MREHGANKNTVTTTRVMRKGSKTTILFCFELVRGILWYNLCDSAAKMLRKKSAKLQTGIQLVAGKIQGEKRLVECEVWHHRRMTYAHNSSVVAAVATTTTTTTVYSNTNEEENIHFLI